MFRERFISRLFRRMAAVRTVLLITCFVFAVSFVATASTATADPAGPPQAADRASFTFGVFPCLSPLRLEMLYAPIGKALGEGVGRPVRFKTASKFKTFFARLEAGEYDIAFIQPLWVPPALDRFGYLPLARIEEPLSAVVVVRDDSPIRSAADLRGKVVATPPSIGPVTRMGTRALIDHGLKPGRDIEIKAFKSVDSCFHQVVIGSASACVSGPLVLGFMEEKLKVKLRVLIKTPGIPSLTFVAHSRVPAEDRSRLRQTIVTWADSEAGRELMRKIGASRFVPASNREYDVVRTMFKEMAPR